MARSYADFSASNVAPPQSTGFIHLQTSYWPVRAKSRAVYEQRGTVANSKHDKLQISGSSAQIARAYLSPSFFCAMQPYSMNSTCNLGKLLQEHVLSDGVLPFAPRRPFAGLTAHSLAVAADLTRSFPEKCGILTHVVRGHIPDEGLKISNGVTIEAHFDSTAIDVALANRLVELGFEPDGFAQFVPSHFSDHFTLKFRAATDDTNRIRELRAEVDQRCESLIQEVTADRPELECYLEVEIYSQETRRRWNPSSFKQGSASHMPFMPGQFTTVDLPRNESDARRLDISMTLVKRADIHVKISRETSREARETLIKRLEGVGFYRVLTWAGNDICTAQFARVADARQCFLSLENFFDRHGGCSELTLEPVARVWRSRQFVDGELRLGALPPLVTSIRNASSHLPEAASSR